MIRKIFANFKEFLNTRNYFRQRLNTRQNTSTRKKSVMLNPWRLNERLFFVITISDPYTVHYTVYQRVGILSPPYDDFLVLSALPYIKAWVYQR